VPIDANDPRPAYIQIADDIERAIRSGEIVPGRLKSGRDLAKHYGVAVMTVRQAVQTLQTRGLIGTKGGRGYFVRSASEVEAERGAADDVDVVAGLKSLRDDLRRLERRVTSLEGRQGS
jgi:DNA-binding GntR family transcriptional regulator